MLSTVTVKMKVLHFIIWGAYLTWCAKGDNVTSVGETYCFQFTWLGPLYNSHSIIKVDCSNTLFTGIPCIEPMVLTPNSRPPNTTELWKKWHTTANNTKSIACSLKSGYTCVKYSYTYNGAIINTTHFCGKVIEDRSLAVTSGCYTYAVDGHIIEACTCQSHSGNIPCNSSNKSTHLTILLFITIGILFLNSIWYIL